MPYRWLSHCFHVSDTLADQKETESLNLDLVSFLSASFHAHSREKSHFSMFNWRVCETESSTLIFGVKLNISP